MSYQALYRAFRPRTFEDVVGQSHITQTLQNALISGKFSHAYLFSGPRGTGKTSAAKIFAQTINCEQMPTREPCNECTRCLGILDGSISDVIEIDAASNTSVEDIRDIRDKVKYAPSVVPYKVYIIDEVHMISINAFNALLKTLEEPPAHVVFILATTEPHKIPLTIISRCQRFDFRTISNQTIVERMRYITSHENVAITDEALDAIALAAEGGMRDALSILDQTISYSNSDIGLDDVLAVTGGVAQNILTDIASALYEKDTKVVLEQFDTLIQSGKDSGRFVFDFIYYLRDLLFYKSTPDLTTFLERAIVTDEFKKLAAEVDVEWIQQAIMTLTECEQQIKWTNSPKIFVEVALLTIANRHFQQVNEKQSENVTSEVTQLLSQIDKLESRIADLEKNPVAPQEKQVTKQGREPNRSQRKGFAIPTERIYTVLNSAEKSELQQLQSRWGELLEQLKAASAPAHATLINSKPVAASPNAVVVAFRYEIHCTLFLDHKEMTESILANIASYRSIVPVPEEAWTNIRAEYISKHDNPSQAEDKQVEPIVAEAIKLFGEDIVEIQD